MPRTIVHFMWGYQEHFRVNQQCVAERVFRVLDARFEPEVFLVGIRGEEGPDRFIACVEPEDDFWIPSEAFDRVVDDYVGIRQTYPESRLLQSHPIAQQWQDERLFKRSLRDAVRNVIEACPAKPSDTTYSVSYPTKVACYWVFVVLGLQGDVLASHYALATDHVPLHECRDVLAPPVSSVQLKVLSD